MNGLASRTPAWEWLALAAAAFVVVALPAYYLLGTDEHTPQAAAPPTADFVGSVNCRECHEPEYDRSKTGQIAAAQDREPQESSKRRAADRVNACRQQSPADHSDEYHLHGVTCHCGPDAVDDVLGDGKAESDSRSVNHPVGGVVELIGQKNNQQDANCLEQLLQEWTDQ